MTALVESIVVAASGWVVSPLIARWLNKLVDSLGINVEEVRLELIDITLRELKSKIDKVEASENLSMWKEFLQRLKNAYDDAGNTLDLHKYSQLQCEVASAARCVMPMPVLKHRRKIKLRRRLNKLKKITGEAKDFFSRVETDRGVAVPGSRQTTSLPPTNVFGRDEDRDEIIRRLKNDSGSTGIPVIAIVGRPGIGKTTLAQHVCQKLKSEELVGRPGVEKTTFDPVLWVDSSYSFSSSKIMENIIRQVSNPNSSENSLNVSMIESHQVLQIEMEKKLKGKKFLLVIDDVGNDGEYQDQNNNWVTPLRCLTQCFSPGSTILVTSQKEDAPRKFATADSGATLKYTHYLKELEQNHFLDLFMHHIQLSGEIDSSLRKYLEEKCKTIAKKLNKDPTAAKIVGETISKIVGEEISSNMANLPSSQGILRKIAEKDWSGYKTKALMWSYQHLPLDLQHFFMLLSLYPRGHDFEYVELVQLWMAQDFIKDQEKMEDVINGYLNELESRFYIQRLNRDHSSDRYTLLELFWDLAEKVSCNDCFRIKDNYKRIPPTIRHLSIPACKLHECKKEICKLKRLRTLIITRRSDANTSQEIVATGTSQEIVEIDVCKNWNNLHVLISEVNIKNLAEFISEMKLLRILQVPGTSEFVLPESVRTLYLLKVLKIKEARLLPEDVNKLVSLKYLESSSGVFPISAT